MKPPYHRWLSGVDACGIRFGFAQRTANLTGHGASASPDHESTRAMTGFPHPGPLPKGEGDKVAATYTVTVWDLSARVLYQQERMAVFDKEAYRKEVSKLTREQRAALAARNAWRVLPLLAVTKEARPNNLWVKIWL